MNTVYIAIINKHSLWMPFMGTCLLYLWTHHMVLGHSASGAQQLRYLVGVVCKIPIIGVVPVVLPP